MNTRRLLGISVLAFLLVSAAACDTDGDADGSDVDAVDASDVTDTESSDVDAADDVTDDADSDVDADVDGDGGGDDCQVDCELVYTCTDGVVYEHPWRVSCEAGASACNESSRLTQTYECEQGCFLTENYRGWPFVDSAPEMCEENRPRAVGEPCEQDADCAPSESDPLECDMDSGECVDPSVPDYLGYCDLATAELDVGEGFVEAPEGGFDGCGESNYCYVERTDAETCQSCTIPCESEADCPSGSTCESVSPLGGEAAGPVNICVQKQDTVVWNDYAECRSSE